MTIKDYAVLNTEGKFVSVMRLPETSLLLQKNPEVFRIYRKIAPEVSETEVLVRDNVQVTSTEVVETFTKRALTSEERFLKRVPSKSVALWAFKAVAEIHGYTAQIEAALESLDASAKAVAKAQWEYATVIERYHPTTVAISQALNLTSDQLDDLFIAAKTIQES